MKKFNYLNIIIVVLLSTLLVSCEYKSIYPRYSIEKINIVPDSLKPAHREWIKETVRAASTHMTGGDYEDVDETILQAEQTAKRIFEIQIIGLRKEINDDYYSDIIILPSEFTEYEKHVLDSLRNNR